MAQRLMRGCTDVHSPSSRLPTLPRQLRSGPFSVPTVCCSFLLPNLHSHHATSMHALPLPQCAHFPQSHSIQLPIPSLACSALSQFSHFNPPPPRVQLLPCLRLPILLPLHYCTRLLCLNASIISPLSFPCLFFPLLLTFIPPFSISLRGFNLLFAATPPYPCTNAHFA